MLNHDPVGTYCFYKFNSPAFVYWFVPGMLMTLFLILFFYIRIFHHLSTHLNNVASLKSKQTQLALHHQVARRSFTLVLLFFGGWGWAVVCSLLETFDSPVTPGMDVALAVLGVLHTTVVPIFHLHTNTRLRKAICSCYCCSSPRRVRVHPSSYSTLVHLGSFPTLPPSSPTLEIVIHPPPRFLKS